MPRKQSPSTITTTSTKKPPLTLSQITAYDDILTDALIDHAFYWTTIPKNRPSYHPSRGLREDDVAKIITEDIIIANDLDIAEAKMLATPGLKRFLAGLKTDGEKAHFRDHLRRYMRIWKADCKWEVSSTNRYTITMQEAAVMARSFIKRGEPIRYLEGIQVVLTPEEEREMTARKKDFSIVVSARNKNASLFMGPARFANHDCRANGRLKTTGNMGIEIVAVRDIEVGEEITVTYAASYFGEGNCECLCRTCEEAGVNGWGIPGESVKRSIEEADGEGYALRTRRGKKEVGGVSVEEVRPRVGRAVKRKGVVVGGSTRGTGSPDEAGQRLSVPVTGKRKMLESPPGTPSSVKKARSEEVRDIEKAGGNLSLAGGEGAPLTPDSGIEDTLPILAGASEVLVVTSSSSSPSSSLTTAPVIAVTEIKSGTETTTATATVTETIVVTVTAPADVSSSLSLVKLKRTPGDYTLTPLLLCEPETAWVTCTICSESFVQKDAYYTRSACPRCERHSKLFGFVWPRTEGPEGERVRDHRTVHRFLGTVDEKRARGRKV